MNTKKDILLIANYWHFEDEKRSSRYRSFADLLCQYYDLEVITSTFCHLKKEQRVVSEIDVKSLSYKVTLKYESGYNKNICLKRLWSHRKFGRNVLEYLKRRKTPDMIIVSVPSLSVADCVTGFAKKKGIPVMIDIQDLWPEAFKMAFNIPVLSNILFFPMLMQANRIYRRADEIMAVSDTYVIRGRSYNKRCRGLSVYIGTDSLLVEEKTREITVNKKENEFWIAYIGALGHSYDIKSIINAVKQLQDTGYSNILFKIMGDGVLREEFEQHAKRRGARCEFMGLLEYGHMMKTLMECDIAINPIIGSSVSSIINKVSDYAAAGLPVVNTQNSAEYRSLLEKYQAGINVENGNVDHIASAIQALYDNPEKRNFMSHNARTLFREKFDRRSSYKRILNVIDNMLLK